MEASVALGDRASEVTHCPFSSTLLPTEASAVCISEGETAQGVNTGVRLPQAISEAAYHSHQ